MDKNEEKYMYQEFQGFEEVYEVVIPSKRDIRGKRYGSVCFFDVINKDILATKLDNIFIEGRNIHANVPKFQRRSF